jgi:hypothetical protein
MALVSFTSPGIFPFALLAVFTTSYGFAMILFYFFNDALVRHMIKKHIERHTATSKPNAELP